MMKLLTTKGYLLLIDEDAEIKAGDIVVHNFGMGYEIEEPCDKDNLKSNTRFKILGYRRLNENTKELDLPLLPKIFDDKTYWIASVIFKDGTKLKSDKFYKYDSGIKSWSSNFSYLMADKIESISYDKHIENQPEQFSLEEQSENYYEELYESGAVKPHEKSWIKSIYQHIFKTGYKAAQSKTNFTLEDIKKAIEFAYNAGRRVERNAVPDDFKFETYREELIQSLTTQQLPKEFTPEYEYKDFDYVITGWSNEIPKTSIKGFEKRLKTIINSEGKEVLVGTYKY